MKEANRHIFIYAGVAALLAILAFNALTISQLSGEFTAKVDAAKQKAAPPEIELTTIGSSCKECSSVSDIVAELKGTGLNIVKETALEKGTGRAEALIEEYGIERLPAIIMEGETEKIDVQGFRRQGSVLLFDSIQAPYEDAFSGKIVGRVLAIIVEDENCSICADYTATLENFKQNRVLIAEERKIDYRTEEGESIISRNSIERIPALLLSEDIDAYPSILQSLSQLNLQPENGFYSIESTAPYVEAGSGKLRGVVDIIYLDDEACADCYDVKIHRQTLARFGIALDEEETIDASSSKGQQLIQKHGIEKVPTVILQGDVEAYAQFEALWLEQVGTREEDGSYVFRELAALGEDAKFRELG